MRASWLGVDKPPAGQSAVIGPRRSAPGWVRRRRGLALVGGVAWWGFGGWVAGFGGVRVWFWGVGVVFLVGWLLILFVSFWLIVLGC